MKLLVFFFAMLCVTTQSFAFLDCTRPVKKLWSGLDSSRIYVVHGDGYSPSAMKLEYVGSSEAIINRTLSIIMSGAMAGKTVTFRYTGGEDGSPASCAPSVPQKLIGAFVSFP